LAATQSDLTTARSDLTAANELATTKSNELANLNQQIANNGWRCPRCPGGQGIIDEANCTCGECASWELIRNRQSKDKIML